MSNDKSVDENDKENKTEENTAFYHVPESRVAHHDRDCHHLDNAKEVEEIDSEEAETYRTCYQCSYNQLSDLEKLRRKRKSSRQSRKSKTTVRIRR